MNVAPPLSAAFVLPLRTSTSLQQHQESLTSSFPLGAAATGPSIMSNNIPELPHHFTAPPFVPTPTSSIPTYTPLSSLDILTQAASARRLPPADEFSARAMMSSIPPSQSGVPESWVSENGIHGTVPFRSVPVPEKKKRLRRKTKSEPLRCFHCGVTNTLHWRYGPNGKNTLCNACGLKYAKSVKQQTKAPSAEKLRVEWLLN